MEETNPSQTENKEESNVEKLPSKYSFTYNEKENIPKSSTYLFVLRIILLILSCIFIPMYSIIYSRLDKIETEKFFSYYDKIIPKETTYESKLFYAFASSSIFIFTNKYMVIILLGIVYLAIDPFLSLKNIFVVSIIDYIFVALKMLYLHKRPFWLEESQTKFCYCDYATPSDKIFIQTFFYLYLFLQISKKFKGSFSIIIKILLSFCYIVLSAINILVLLCLRIFYLHQICFSVTFSLIILSIVSDMDNSLEKLLKKATKNIFKIRKYKMKVFFLVLIFFVFSLMLVYFSAEDDLNEVEMAIYKNPNCNVSEEEEIGKKNTIKQSTFIFTLLGAFWGASLTIEKGTGQWWKVSLVNFFIKFLCFSGCLGGLIIIFYFIPYFTFEFDFCLFALEYFIFYYSVFGLMPLLFEKLKLNQKITAKAFGQERNKLFTQSIFTETYVEKYVDDFVVVSKEDEEKKKEGNEEGNDKLLPKKI
ncbi:MAG: hypothetical protein MJ252_11795, partial [archaeon]|nr:hypothetical protein [archaeon]